MSIESIMNFLLGILIINKTPTSQKAQSTRMGFRLQARATPCGRLAYR